MQAGYDVFLQREGRLPTSNAESGSGNANTSYDLLPVSQRRRIDVTLGPVLGTNYFYPVVPSIQMAMGRGFSLGIDLRWTQFAKLGVASHALGVMANVNYYYNRNTFRGLFFSAGVGLYSLELKNAAKTESQMPIAVQGLMGWRLKPRWAYGVDIGLAGGVQYITKKSGGLTNDFGGLMPVATLYLGYTF